MYPTFIILIAFLFSYYLKPSKFSKIQLFSILFFHIFVNVSFMILISIIDENRVNASLTPHSYLFFLNIIIIEILIHFLIYGIKNELIISNLSFFTFSLVLFFHLHPQHHGAIYKEKYQYTTDYKENFIRQYVYNDMSKDYIPMVKSTVDNNTTDMWIKYSGQDDMRSYYVAYSKINHYDISPIADVLARFYIGNDGGLIFIDNIVVNIPGKDLITDYLKIHPNIHMNGFQAPAFYDSLPIT